VHPIFAKLMTNAEWAKKIIASGIKPPELVDAINKVDIALPGAAALVFHAVEAGGDTASLTTALTGLLNERARALVADSSVAVARIVSQLGEIGLLHGALVEGLNAPAVAVEIAPVEVAPTAPVVVATLPLPVPAPAPKPSVADRLKGLLGGKK